MIAITFFYPFRFLLLAIIVLVVAILIYNRDSEKAKVLPIVIFFDIIAIIVFAIMCIIEYIKF